jgi:hypothetical protein
MRCLYHGMKFWSNLLLRPISSNLAAGPCAENSYFKIHEMIAPRRAVHPCSTGATPLLRDAVRQNIVAFDGDFDDDFVVVNGEARLQRDPRASLRRVGMAAFGDSHAVEDDEISLPSLSHCGRFLRHLSSIQNPRSNFEESRKKNCGPLS